MKKYIIFIAINLAMIVGVAYGFSLWNKTKVAFVRSHDLVYSYEGTKEAMAKFNNQKQQWQANADTLKLNFQNEIKKYNAEYQTMTPSERQQKESRLSVQEQQLQSYTNAISKKIEEEDNAMMEAVLSQVNSYVQEYAEIQGYDIVLGTTLSGSVLYGSENLDITDELVKALNIHYRGED